MFTHSAVNFTWHQLSEHTLLHASYPSKRKEEEEGPSPCDCNVLYSPFLSFMPPFILCLVLLGLLRSDILVLLFVPQNAEQREKQDRSLLSHTKSTLLLASQTTDWFCFSLSTDLIFTSVFRQEVQRGIRREGTHRSSSRQLYATYAFLDFKKHSPQPFLVLIRDLLISSRCCK